MKFGKTYKQIQEEYQEYLKKWHNKRQKVFAWIPIATNNGIVVWIDYVWKDLGIYQDSHKIWYYIGDYPIYYQN